MVSCLDVIRYFILKSYQDEVEAAMTNMKAQKLLYYAQSIHLVLYDSPFFPEEIQAWRYGPVCPPAYHYYSEFEAKQLPLPKEQLQLSQEQKELLEEVWENFGFYNAYQLRDLTHQEFPWQKARQGLPREASSTETILLEDLKELGQEKLAEIERNHPAYATITSQVLNDALSADACPPIGKGEVHDWLTSLLH